jgi:HEAT repeat protein
VLDKKADETLRLAAARALAKLSPSGLEATAQQLLAPNASILERALAAMLLTRHKSDATKALMVTLAQDAEPAVARLALASLVQIDPLAIKPIAPKLLKSPDVEVRRLAATAVTRQNSPEAVAALWPLLDDEDFSLRRDVARCCSI